MNNSSKKQEEEVVVTPYWSKIEFETFARVTRRATPEEIGTAMQRYMAVWAGAVGEAEAYDGLSAKSADILDLMLENLGRSRESFAKQSRAGREARAQVGKGKSKKMKQAAPEQAEAEQVEAVETEPEQAGSIKYGPGTDEHFIAHSLAQWIADNATSKTRPRWSNSEIDKWADVIHKSAEGSRNRAPIDIATVNEALYWAVVVDTPDKHPDGGKWHGWSSVIKSGAQLLDKGSNSKAKSENIVEVYRQNQANLYHNMEVQNDVELW